MDDSHALAAYLAIGVAASVLMAAGLLLMKSRAAELPAARAGSILRALRAWLRDPVWLGAVAIQAAGYALYIVALAAAPVSLVAVMMQGGIAIFVVFAAALLHERASPREWMGIAAIVVAMLMLAFSLEGGAAEGAANIPRLLSLAAVACGIAIAPFASGRARHSGAAAAIASGVAFGLGSLFTKALTDWFLAASNLEVIIRALSDPWLYCASAANLAGLVMLQNSFHSARGIIVMPLSSACSNLVPIVGGMVAFGEALPSNPLAASLRVGAFVLTIAASASLAASQR